MDAKLLELHFSQLQSEWITSKYNNYSDVRKSVYHENLGKIITSLEKEDFKTYVDAEIIQRFYVITFLFKSLEFLNNSTVSKIPFEIVFVLEEALKDWVKTDESIIVTSLVNGMNQFSFDPSLMLWGHMYVAINLLYNVTFARKLIQINIPLSLSRDYLANAVLYHELGHFVDRKFEITRVIYIELLVIYTSNPSLTPEKQVLLKYFPYLADPSMVTFLQANYDMYNIFANHIAEYLCDIFASQYILDCSNRYLEYITLNQKDFNVSHPSTINRVEVANSFLNSTPNFFVEKIKEIVFKITSIELVIRMKKIDSKNFESLIPVEVSGSEELHGLFYYGWQVWLNDWSEFRTHSEIDYDLTQVKVYEIINNLIEKSIGNYLIKNQWESSKI